MYGQETPFLGVFCRVRDGLGGELGEENVVYEQVWVVQDRAGQRRVGRGGAVGGRHTMALTSGRVYLRSPRRTPLRPVP